MSLQFSLLERLFGIEIVIDPTNSVVTLQVNDTGCGVLPQDIPLLFTKFSPSQGESVRSNDGAGLGLAISRR